MNAPRLWLTAAGLLGALGVGLGAYAAHGLEKRVEAVVKANSDAAASATTIEDAIARRVENWKTAVHYQMTHVAALLVIGLAAARWPMKRWSLAGAAMLVGVALFSGVLYYEALVPEQRLGLFVMFGGISYIAGWLLLASAAFGISDSRGERS